MSGMSKRIKVSPDIRDNKRVRYTEDGMAVTTLSLSPLGKEVTATQLYDYFSTFGPVDNVHITALGYATFGSVKFTHAESAAQALNLKRHSIAGHSISATVASNLHQAEPIKFHLPVELTNVTGTCLVDLNEDCLWKILSSKYLGLMDLLSVAEACKRLKEVAKETFRREHKVSNMQRHSAARRIFFNFGTVIPSIKIDSDDIVDGFTVHIIDLGTNHWSTNLKSLFLKNCGFNKSMGNSFIPLFKQLAKIHLQNVKIEGSCKDLFANCKSLAELTIFEAYECPESDRWCSKIGNQTFSELKHFVYDYGGNFKYNWENFVRRNKTLRSFSLHLEEDCSYLLSIIAKNCSQLEQLSVHAKGENISDYDYGNALNSLLILDKLKVLKLITWKRNVKQFIEGIHHLKSLESFELVCASEISESIPGLVKLTDLKVLRLIACTNPKELNLLCKLDKLRELRLEVVPVDKFFDVVKLVKSLYNLDLLSIRRTKFEIDKRKYLEIVDVVKARPDKTKRNLTIHCNKDFILDDDDKNRRIVNLSYVNIEQ